MNKKTIAFFNVFPVLSPLNPFRWWRVKVEQTNEGPLIGAGALVGMRYIGMAGSVGGTDVIDPLLYNTRGWGSTNNGGGSESAYNVFRGPDDLSNGVVQGDAVPSWWYRWDFGEGTEQIIQELIMSARHAFESQHPRKFTLQKSGNNVDWVDEFVVDTTADPTMIWMNGRAFRFNSNGKPADPGQEGGHRWWRVRVKTFNDPAWITLRNIRFYEDSAMTIKHSVAGAAFGAARVTEGSAEGAFDNAANRLSTSAGYQMAADIRFPTRKVVNGMSMMSRDGFGGQSADTFSIDYSDDGQNWYECWAVPSQSPWGNNEERFFANPDPVEVPVIETNLYRLITTFCYQYDNTQYRELGVAETVGGDNFAIDAPVAASSQFGANSPARAVDGDTSTFFAHLGSKNTWFTIELPQENAFGSIKILPTSTAVQSPKEIVVQQKVGGKWVTIGDVDYGESTPVNNVWRESAVTPLSDPAISINDPHRYWRLHAIGSGLSSDYIEVLRLKLFTEGGTDVTLTPGKVVAFSNEYNNTNFAAVNLFLDNTNRWGTTNVPQKRQWVSIDLGEGNEAQIVRYELTCGPSQYAPTAYRIEFSDDNVNWKVADEKLLLTWNTNQMRSHYFTTIAAESVVWDLPYTPVGAWGLRRLVEGYNGPLVRVRDTSTSTEFDIGMDSNGYLDDFTTTGNAAVVRVYDQTGGDDLIQATTTLQPLLLKNATPNGRPAIKGDGTDDFLKGATAGTGRPYMVSQPLAVWIGGAGSGNPAHEAYPKLWIVPNIRDYNISPWVQFGHTWNIGSGSETANLETRTGSTSVIVPVNGFTSRRGWGGLAYSAAAALNVESGYRNGIAAAGGPVTYPNVTNITVFANGEGNENWGGHFSELIIFDAASANEAAMEGIVFDQMQLAVAAALYS